MSQHASIPVVRNWTPDQLPDLSGKTYIITGGNSGIGYEAALMLVKASARVVLACRSPEKAVDAASAIEHRAGARPEIVHLDLADLSSVRRASEEVADRFECIHGLINNAGIMQTPQLKTKDGFELQLGSNHLGHFLWTARLFKALHPQEGRVVTVASIAHRFGKMHFDDLMLERNYDPTRAYGQSKLANLLAALELHRRLYSAGSTIKSVACHPGYSATNLQSTGPSGFFKWLYGPMNAVFAQPARKGAIPTVLAAAGTEAVSGGYYGPTKMNEFRGPVGNAKVSPQALDEGAATKLWKMSEELVGEAFDLS